MVAFATNHKKSDDGMTVLRLHEVDFDELADFLSCWSLQLVVCAKDQPIPGSFWGDDEAGLIKNRLFAWPDTPLHSIFHEASHFICLDEVRRLNLHTNAGSDVAEENAVCYLQILLAKTYRPMGFEKMVADMDSWGYSFRLGSSRRWFYEDAEDARNWLLQNHLIDEKGNVRGCLRGQLTRPPGEIARMTGETQTTSF